MRIRPISTPQTYRLVPKYGASSRAAPNSTPSDAMPEIKTSGSSSRRGRTVTLNSRLSDRLLCRPLACLLVHRDRELNAHLRVHVARRATFRVGQPEATQADLGPVLGLCRDRELDLAALDRWS